MRPRARLFCALFGLGLATVIFGARATAQSGRRSASRPLANPSEVRYPDPDVGVQSLAARAKAQRETAAQFKVDYQFQFADSVRESGITFVHHSVDDAARFHK